MNRGTGFSACWSQLRWHERGSARSTTTPAIQGWDHLHRQNITPLMIGEFGTTTTGDGTGCDACLPVPRLERHLQPVPRRGHRGRAAAQPVTGCGASVSLGFTANGPAGAPSAATLDQAVCTA